MTGPFQDHVAQQELSVESEASLYTTLLGIIILQRLLLAVEPEYTKYERSRRVVQRLEHTRPQILFLQNYLHATARQRLAMEIRDDETDTESIAIDAVLLRILEEQCHSASMRQATPGQNVFAEEFDPKIWTSMHNCLPLSKGVLSCVAYLPVTTSPVSGNMSRLDADVRISDRVSHYKRAALLIKHLFPLLKDVQEQMDRSERPDFLQIHILDHTFPASHIALLNGDGEAAFKLWQEDHDTPGIDLLGRSLPHLAVVYRNIDLLKKLWDFEKTSLQVQNDFQDLSLEDTAKILNDKLTLVVLQELIGYRHEGCTTHREALEDLNYTQAYINNSFYVDPRYDEAIFAH